MTDPTPADVRAKLAELLGWRVADRDRSTGYPPVPVAAAPYVGPTSVMRVRLPDPATDLNAMSAVEAALRARGLAAAYLTLLADLLPAQPASLMDWQWAAVTAPAAVRALAAYRVLRDSEGKSCA